MTTLDQKMQDLKDTLEKDAQEKQILLKQKMSALNAEQRKAGEYYLDDNGKRRNYWDDVSMKAGELSKSDMKSYVEWSTSIGEIFDALVVFNKALQATVGPCPAGRFVKWLWEKTPGDALIDKGLKKVGLRNKQAQEISYKVEVDDDGKLNTEVLIDGDKLSQLTGDKDTDKRQKNNFDAAFVAWADTRGYKFDSATQKLTDKTTGLPMTPDILQDLGQDDEHGFNAFFKEKSGLDIHTGYTTSTPKP